MGITGRHAIAGLGAGLTALVMTVLLGVSGAAAQEPPGTTTTSAPPGTTQPEDDEVEVVRGTVAYEEDDERIPVADVEIVVEATDGSFTETVTTDEDGQYEVELPAPVEYRVTIDPAGLPQGISLSDEERTTLILGFTPGQTRTALFRVTTGEEESQNKLINEFARKSVDGLRFGLVIAMAAVGLSLIFGTTGLTNFAHGEMVTFGALMAYLFNVTWGIEFFLAVPLAVVAGGLAGALFNRGVWRPLRNRGTGLVAMMVTSIGVGILLRYIFLYQFNASSRSFRQYLLQKPIEIGPISIVVRNIWVMALSALVLVGVALLLQKTRVGKAMRAVADNRDLAESSGIDVERVIAWVWIAGGGLAALGGVFHAMSEQVLWQGGFQLLLLMFAAVTLGGLGQAYGALAGGLVIGLFFQLSTIVIPTEFKTAAALMVMIVVLMVRPQGILGQAERVG